MKDATKCLVVIDMQNDFIDGALANPEAQKIVDKVADYIRNFDGLVYYTRDTHRDNYLETQEGKRLPVVHCIVGTPGWELNDTIKDAIGVSDGVFNKPAFGSTFLGKSLKKFKEVYFCGVCTDICVISNVLLAKAAAPETRIAVLKDLCAGTTVENHEIALKAMANCQVDII